MENKKLPQIRFSEAAAKLSQLCNRIENDVEDIDQLLIEEFQDALTDVSASIDRRKAFYREIESKIEMAKKFRDEVTRHIKKYENIRDRLRELTKQVVLANPNVPFKDSMGKNLMVIDNPDPKLVYGVSLDEVDPIYIKQTILREIDTNRVKEDLLAGKQISWAKLEYGKQLRGIK